ncbi:RNA-guided endonuclease TnpB family protein [Alicyclobacillus macrosporangiidus]|uniref:Transposase, IS605 OrfB family, central region n=1 Tax=Alicyclobacillus macrosporangiidus TaxID=392015 RepID=A0A1I7L1V2_9BACL|nr:RNA-guided endonuclease TnpB family protein [Alicyclobacillus macrosporangiidus]SFV03752.1 transposase, IS605 OrfB family, central region [Alicyclobacillus macrosporangiidus]
MKLVKTMRYQIIKPLSCDWDTLGTVLRELQRDTHSVLNKTIQLCWEWQGYSSEYKAANGTYPTPKDTLGRSLEGYVYDRLKVQFPKMYTPNLSQTIQRAMLKWSADSKAIFKGEVSIPSYKKDVPLDLRKDSIHIERRGHDYILSLGLVSRAYKKELGLPECQIEVLIGTPDKTQRVILARLLTGEYTVSGSQIVWDKRNRKWFVNLAYHFEARPEQLDKTKILGVDLGVVFPVYMAVADGHFRAGIPGGEIEEFRRRVEARRRQLLRQGKYCGDGRIGHGRATRTRPLDKIADKIARFRDTINHKYSRYVVETARKLGCGVIQMEDLTGIREENLFLANWPYHDLQRKIEYKAREYGIEVRYVRPQYTSQRCSDCGYIHPDNRPEQAKFRCLACGFETNADYNAARNIATEGIEELIAAALNKASVV